MLLCVMLGTLDSKWLNMGLHRWLQWFRVQSFFLILFFSLISIPISKVKVVVTIPCEIQAGRLVFNGDWCMGFKLGGWPSRELLLI